MSQLSQPRKFSCKVPADSRRRFGNMFVVICHSHVCSMILNKVNSYLKCTELIVLAKSSNCILNQMKWYQNTFLKLHAIKIPSYAGVETKMAKMVQPPFLLPFSLFFMKTRRGTNHLSQTPQAYHRECKRGRSKQSLSREYKTNSHIFVTSIPSASSQISNAPSHVTNTSSQVRHYDK